MITSISLSNVRAFRGGPWDFDLKQLTAICGGNSAGKSTIIKALLFIRENARLSQEDEETVGRIQFSGRHFDLGDFRSFVTDNDIRCRLTVGLTTEGTVEVTENFYKALEKLLPKKVWEANRSAWENRAIKYTLQSAFSFRYVPSGARASTKKGYQPRKNDPGFGILESSSFTVFIAEKRIGQFSVALRSSGLFPMKKDAEHRYVCRITKKFFDASGGPLRVVPEKTSEDKNSVEFTPVLGGILPLAFTGREPARAGTSSKSAERIVSRSYLRGLVKPPPGAIIRVPARDLEAAVIKALKDLPGNAKPSANHGGSADPNGVLARVERIELRAGQLAVWLKQAQSATINGFAAPQPDRERQRPLFIPWTKPPSKRFKEVLLPADTERRRVRPIKAERRAALLKSIARGRAWLEQIALGTATIEDIAARQKCCLRYVDMTVSMAFIAPALVAAIVEGRLPRGIGVAALREGPAEWSLQFERLGLAKP